MNSCRTLFRRCWMRLPGLNERQTTQIQALLAILFLLGTGLLLALLFRQQPPAWLSFVYPWLLPLLAIGLCLLGLCNLGKKHVLLPLRHMAEMLLAARTEIIDQSAALPSTSLSIRSIAREFATLLVFVHENHRKQAQLAATLEECRQSLHRVRQQHDAVLHASGRAMMVQYQSVLTYANYLETLVASGQGDASLRYDFDDVCESAFNLKLITHALEYMRQPASEGADSCFTMAGLMEQTLVALSASMERRNMRLTTAEMDLHVTARGNPKLIYHAAWMMLLGIVRFAADESTLRMRCLYNTDRTQAILSLTISELAPGRLSEAEREAHLERQLKHLTPHMFAVTIRQHANLQLAELLLQPHHGTLHITPISHYACEICLLLPAALP